MDVPEPDGTEPGSADGPAPDPVDGAPLPLALAELLNDDVPFPRLAQSG